MSQDTTFSQLISLDHNTLFEKYNKNEVEVIHTKLQNEIEKKKEELRTMVGERYRDLINAADSIESMETLALKVINDIDNLSKCCLQLKNKINFKQHNSPRKISNQSDLYVRNNIAAQLKVIIDLSKEIWNCIDNEQFLKATQLFQLVCFIKTSLDVNHRLNIDAEFLIAKQLWHSIAHFQQTIIGKSEEKLQSNTLTVETGCECLCSSMLLESLNFEELQTKFLQLRSDALKSCFLVDDELSSIKACVSNSLSLISNTLHTFYFCFVDSNVAENGLIMKQILQVTDPDSTPVLFSLKFNEDIELQKFLPPLIQNFRPSLTQEVKLEELNKSKIVKFISNWLNWVTELINSKGKSIFKMIATARSLQTIQEHNMNVPADWPLIVEKLSLSVDLDLWSYFYHPLFMERAKELISQQWEKTFNNVVQQVIAVLDQTNDLEKKESELDLKWYIWTESSFDLELKNSSKNKDLSGLFLKSKGFSPRIATLCSSLESLLINLLEDLKILIPDSNSMQDADADNLQTHQETCCSLLIKNLSDWIESKVSDLKLLSHIVILARLAAAIPVLCPALQKCLSTGAWLEANSRLQNVNKIAWGAWLLFIIPKLEQDVILLLKIPINVSELLRNHSSWEVVKIEEVNEQGILISSELNVPSLPSFQIQSVISNISSLVSTLSLNPATRDELINIVIQKCLLIYNETSSNANALQLHHLQCLFDVKFLLTTIVPSESKHIINLCNETILKIEQKIDPFDLDVLSPYLHNNVKKALFRIHCMYGVISPEKNFSHKSQDSSQIKSEEPVVIPLSNNVSWFPLLPITSPHSNRSVLSVPKPLSVKSNPASIGTTSKPSSSSNSFFGVSDWFR